MSDESTMYDDGRIACDPTGIRIRWYYLWGERRIPYAAIRSLHRRELTWWRGRWRLWGSGDFRHWYNLDLRRPRKITALELDVGAHIRPTITPDDPGTVARIIEHHLAG